MSVMVSTLPPHPQIHNAKKSIQKYKSNLNQWIFSQIIKKKICFLNLPTYHQIQLKQRETQVVLQRVKFL